MTRLLLALHLDGSVLDALHGGEGESGGEHDTDQPKEEEKEKEDISLAVSLAGSLGLALSLSLHREAVHEQRGRPVPEDKFPRARQKCNCCYR